jgi:peroxiredoxin
MGKSSKAVMTAALACGLAAQGQMKVGDAAPDFGLPSTTGKEIKLSQYKGKRSIVLAFVPAAFTGG